MHTWKLLNWCIPRQISLQELHLSGKENVIADALSRSQAVPTEWSLHRPTVQQIFNILDTPHTLSHRPLCVPSQPSTSNLLHPTCSSSSLGNGLTEPQLVRPLWIRVSSDFPATSSTTKNQTRELQNNFGCPSLAEASLVSSVSSSIF